jgi:hypothetical protein
VMPDVGGETSKVLIDWRILCPQPRFHPGSFPIHGDYWPQPRLTFVNTLFADMIAQSYGPL